MIISNQTNVDVNEYVVGGVAYTIKSGEKQEVSDQHAEILLKNLGFLEVGEEEREAKPVKKVSKKKAKKVSKKKK